MTATELANYGDALPSLSSPIAESGDKRTPAAGSSNETDTQASIKFGLPALMSEPIDESGIPVPRQDLNGMYNLLSKMVHFLMAGGRIPYMASESAAIGGYPQGAEVSYQGHNYKSLVDSNTAVPTDTTKWACIDYLPLTGGTMTGTIVSNANIHLKPAISCENMTIMAGERGLAIHSNGYLTWDGKSIVRSVNKQQAGQDGNVALAMWPDYAASYSIPSGWTAPSNGWIRMRRGATASNAIIYIDGFLVWDSGAYDAHYGAGVVPISKGSVVTFSAYFEWVAFVPAKVS